MSAIGLHVIVLSTNIQVCLACIGLLTHFIITESVHRKLANYVVPHPLATSLPVQM